ncbi:hypothetical protein ABTM11_20845, partial [Acinetobacter baumannii]
HAGRKLLDADVARLRASYPDVFASDGAGALWRIFISLALSGLFAYSVYRLEIDPQRLLKGFGSLWHFLTLMVPPAA